MSLTWNGLRKVLQQTPGWVRRLCPFLCHSCHQRCGCGVGSTLEGRETGPPGPGWEAGAGRVRGQASGAGEGRTVAGTSRREGEKVPGGAGPSPQGGEAVPTRVGDLRAAPPQTTHQRATPGAGAKGQPASSPRNWGASCSRLTSNKALC